MKRPILVFAIIVCFIIDTNAQIIYVPGDQPSIQAGIEAASDGDTVLVADSTYYENINFLGMAITVASHFILDGDTSHISKTIIDGSQSSNPDTASVVTMWSGEDTTSVLMGFTITGGNGTNTLPNDDGIFRVGAGGIFILESGGKIIHNIVEGNHVERASADAKLWGGGICANVSKNHTAIIRDNLVRDNSATGHNAFGGGIFTISGRILCENNHVIENAINSQNLALGGGIFWEYVEKEGVIDEAIFRNNIISENSMYSATAFGGGGGFALTFGLFAETVQVYNNIIHHNYARIGGGILGWHAIGSIFNNTIIDNLTEDPDEYESNIAMIWSDGRALLYNNIIWDSEDLSTNDIWLYDTDESELHIFNNIIRNQSGLAEGVTAYNNTSQEPLFLPDSYELAENSPGIGWGVDSVEILGDWYSAPDHDFNGNTRPNPIDARIDLGAFESSHEGSVFIPDIAFLNALIENGVDTDGNGLISYAEAEAINYLDVSGEEDNIGNIADMTGVEAFVNLDTLIIFYNKVSSLDLSSNTALLQLGIGVNPLTSLDISACTALIDLRNGATQLTSIDLSHNTALEQYWGFGTPLTSIDISNNTELTFFACDNNEITSIDVSRNTKLTSLWTANNPLTELDVSNLTLLEELHSYQNQLTTLDVSNNQELTVLMVSYNLLESLDVSPLISLKTLSCGDNNLGTLDLSNNLDLEVLHCNNTPLSALDLRSNSKLTYIRLKDNTDLGEVCVWTVPFPPEGVDVNREGSPNVCFDTDCDGGCINSIGENSHSKISIYPNPANNLLTIDTDNPGQHSIEITSLNGQLIYSTVMDGTSHQIDLSSYRKGVYLITIRSEDFVTTRKIIKLF